MANEIKLDVLYKIANDLETLEYYKEATSVDRLIKESQSKFLGWAEDTFNTPIQQHSGFGDTGTAWLDCIEDWKDYFEKIYRNIDAVVSQNPGNVELEKVKQTIEDAGKKFYGRYLGPSTAKGKEIDRAARRERGALKWHEKLLHGRY